MASILDTLIVNQQNQVAPNDRRFNMNEFLTAAGQVKNMNESLNEIQRQNSLRNLIAQRERDGVPFDRISNEAAKYDLGKALSMRGEARESIGFNQQQSDIELKRFKSEMAGYWFGEVLRRTQKEGKGVEEIAAIAKEAAGLIAPYDSELAYRLLNMAQNDAYKRDALSAKAQGTKPFKDHELEIASAVEKANQPSPDSESDPKSYQRRLSWAKVGEKLLAWKNEDPYDAVFNPDGRTIYKRMMTALFNTPNWNKLTNEDLTRMFGNGHSMNDEQSVDEVKNQEQPKTTAQAESQKPSSSEGGVNGESSLPDTIMRPSRSGSNAWVYDGEKGSKLIKAIRDAADENELNKAEEVLIRSGDLKKNDSGAYNKIEKAIEDKRKQLQKFVEDMGANTPATRLIAKTLTARGKQAEARRLRMIGVVANGLYSGTPYSIMDNIIMVQSPDYQPSDAMQKTARQVVNGEWTTEIASAFANSSKGLLGALAANSTVYDALEAGARDALNTVRPAYRAMLEECKNDEERKELKHALKVTYSWPDRLFKALEDPNGSLGTAATIEKKSKELSKNKVNIYEDDEGKNTAPSTGSKYTKEDWSNF